MNARVLLKIEGRVQGVFFRQSTQEMARQLGLNGWVRNCSDGTVEALFEGAQDVVRQAIDWCHHGPPAARVTSVSEEWQEAQGQNTDFKIRY